MKLLLLLIFPSIWAKSSRIIGGQPAYAGEFPYAAAIYKLTPDGSYFCTGTLLSNEWILTVGQCIDGATLFTIVLGTHKLSASGSNVEKLATDTYVLHPDYNPLTFVNDIGLIKFRIPVTFTTYIRSLALPDTEMAHTSQGITFGWGQTSDAVADLSDNLIYVNVNGVSDEECKLTYGGQITDSMVCFTGNYNEGTCHGDSGSPVIQRVSGGYTVVIAIASFFSGNGCESTDPSGYTKVFPYNDWIKNVTGI